jgi:chromosome segregation ATPase
MKIPSDFLHEKNYEGTKLICVDNEQIINLRGEIAKLSTPAEPLLAKLDKLSKVIDPVRQVILSHQEEIKKLREKISKEEDELTATVAELEKIDSKAQLIKNKLTPLVNKFLEDKLGEFEKPLQVITKEDGKVYVEVVDEIEEKVKAIRSLKSKK